MSSSHYHFCLFALLKIDGSEYFPTRLARSNLINIYHRWIDCWEGPMSRLGKRFNNLIIIICGGNLCVFKWRASGIVYRRLYETAGINFRKILIQYLTTHITRPECTNFGMCSIFHRFVCGGGNVKFCWNEPSRFFDYSTTCLWWSGKNLWLKSIFPLLSKWIYEIYFECELRKWKVDVWRAILE